ncbi:MAG: recombinase family protein [Rickettsiales bacterium]|jgi:site-specific DNA recombinase|nr:recombinase family protein [Rickettsiales bacterium]
MTTVALYARVSSISQAQNNTIKSQIAELKRRIAVDGHELLGEYIFTDDARSGSHLEREGLKNLRKKVAEGKIGKIYIYSLDRLSRDTIDQREVIDEFKDAGVEVIFSNHKVDDTPESDLMTDVQGAVGRFELRQISVRNVRGKLHAAREGYVSVITIAPFGYDRIRHFDREKIRFEINEEEAKIVRQIFVWIGQERVSIREVIRRLRDRSIRTRSGKKVWRPVVIWQMLRNPTYTGQAAFGKLKRVKRRGKNKQKVSICYTDENSWIYIPVPKIVDEGLFNKVQKQLGENRKRARIQREKKEISTTKSSCMSKL